MPNIIIPHKFTPREYQLPFLKAVEKSINGESPIRFFLQIWHRRAGKDLSCISDIAPRMLLKRTGLVKYVYPTLVMGRDNLWTGIDKAGVKFMDHIPQEIRDGEANQGRMTVPIGNGSVFQVAGSNYPDTLRGGNPMGLIFSEWSEQDPYAWDVVQPILEENGGIAVFNFTPKGDNHAKNLYEFARNDPRWFVQLLTAYDTTVFSEDKLEEVKEETIRRFEADGRSTDEAIAYFEQEYLCSFDTPIIGAYYGAAIRKAEMENRLTWVPYEAGLRVNTAWDLGIDDSMTIWFYQTVGMEIRFIDYYENSGEGLPHYIKVLQDKKYLYGKHYAPHDIKVRELGTGKSRLESAAKLGIKFEVGAMLDIDDGINAARSIFSQCWFDKKKCARGILALKGYAKKWNEKTKTFQSHPDHNWCSHGADAFRTFAVGYKRDMPQSNIIIPRKPLQYFPGVG